MSYSNIFLSQIIPAFDEFTASKGQSRLLVVPQCLAAVVDGENDYLVLQDVSVQGYGPVARLNTLNLNELNVLLRAMANFHAVSFAYKDQNAKGFQNLADKLIETYFHQERWDWYKNFHVSRSIPVAKKNT